MSFPHPAPSSKPPSFYPILQSFAIFVIINLGFRRAATATRCNAQQRNVMQCKDFISSRKESFACGNPNVPCAGLVSRAPSAVLLRSSCQSAPSALPCVAGSDSPGKVVEPNPLGGFSLSVCYNSMRLPPSCCGFHSFLRGSWQKFTCD